MRILKRVMGWWLAFTAVSAVAGLVVKRVSRTQDDPSAPSFSLVTVFEGTQFRPTTHELASSRAVTVFGGTQIDLRRTKPASPETRLELVTVFGGVEVIVPDTWRVTLEGVSVLGGHSSRVPDPARLPVDVPRLVVGARTVMGGVSVQARPVIETARTG